MVVDAAEFAADRLLVALGSPAPPDERESIVQALRDAIERARSAWPAVVLAPERFAEYLRARTETERPIAAAIRSVDAAGLWLACACRDGDPGALAAFERAFAEPLGRVLEGLVAPGADADDVRQRLRTRLFLGDGDTAPLIERYAGRGSLGGWLRVIATRMRIDAQRQRTDVPLGEHGAPELASLAEDPELAYLAAHCREAFADAIREAFAALSPRQRNVLRLHLVRGVAAAGIADVYAVHLSSAKRWIADARAELVAGAEAQLRARLGADTRELESVLRVIHSRLEISLRALIEVSRDPATDSV